MIGTSPARQIGYTHSSCWSCEPRVPLVLPTQSRLHLEPLIPAGSHVYQSLPYERELLPTFWEYAHNRIVVDLNFCQRNNIARQDMQDYEGIDKSDMIDHQSARSPVRDVFDAFYFVYLCQQPNPNIFKQEAEKAASSSYRVWL